MLAVNAFKLMISIPQKQSQEGQFALFIPLEWKYLYVCVKYTHTHTHNEKDYIHHLAGEKCKSREPETLSNVWKKKQTGSEGCRNQRKKNITHRKEMCRLKPHFSPLEPSGHLSLEGLMQFFGQKLI